jgi:beta-lactamase superfamily II metal-dependent hydrolase
MLCEVEFLPVGEGSRPGDAIVVRYGEINNYSLMVVDGGTADAGKALVVHLKTQFGEHISLAHVVLTHSDADHASGLREVLREIPVANVWLHIPWLLSEHAIALFQHKGWTIDNLSRAIKREYDIVSEIVDLASSQRCVLHYPFQGAQIGPFTVLSPSVEHYLYLLPQFDKTPEPDRPLIEMKGLWVGKPSNNVLVALMEKAAAKIDKWLPESWDVERLRDGGVTSASNESSVVLYTNLGDDRRVLLTGDGGIRALSWASAYARVAGFPLQNFSCVQIPHHGSRRNVGPSILNELLGPIQPVGVQRFAAFVSAPPDDETHPRKIVLNAFTRRGGRVIPTQGTTKVFYGGFPPRPGYVDVAPMPLSPTVEAYE